MTSRMATPRTTKRWGRLTVGWVLLALGLAALVLPGPGLLLIAAGMAILSQQYLWARRRLAPIRARAMQAAAAGVRSWPAITISVLIALAGVAVGVVWGVSPPAPEWWPLAERWWLPGGWGFGSSMIGSGCIALTLIGFSFWRFRIRESRQPDLVRTPPDRAASLSATTPGSSARDLRRNES
jgi:Putative transmembrane protein (PGPGW)